MAFCPTYELRRRGANAPWRLLLAQKVISYFFKTIHWKNMLLLPKKNAALLWGPVFCSFLVVIRKSLTAFHMGAMPWRNRPPLACSWLAHLTLQKILLFLLTCLLWKSVPSKTGILGLVNKLHIWSDTAWPSPHSPIPPKYLQPGKEMVKKTF